MVNKLNTNQTAFGLKNLLRNMYPFSQNEVRSSISQADLANHISKSFIRHAFQLFKYKEPFSYDNLEFLTDKQGRLIPSDKATETEGVSFEIFQQLWDLTKGGTIWEQFDNWTREASKTVKRLSEEGAFRGSLEGW